MTSPKSSAGSSAVIRGGIRTVPRTWPGIVCAGSSCASVSCASMSASTATRTVTGSSRSTTSTVYSPCSASLKCTASAESVDPVVGAGPSPGVPTWKSGLDGSASTLAGVLFTGSSTLTTPARRTPRNTTMPTATSTTASAAATYGATKNSATTTARPSTTSSHSTHGRARSQSAQARGRPPGMSSSASFGPVGSTGAGSLGGAAETLRGSPSSRFMRASSVPALRMASNPIRRETRPRGRSTCRIVFDIAVAGSALCRTLWCTVEPLRHHAALHGRRERQHRLG